MRTIQNKHGDYLVLADDDTLLGYYGTKEQAQGHIDECAAAGRRRDQRRFREPTDKQRQRLLLSHLDDLPGQTELFAVDGEGGAA